MLEIKITAPELTEAINNLAAALTAHAEEIPSGATNGVTPASDAPVSIESPLPEQEEIPVDVQETVVPVVPTAYVPRPSAQAPQYTLDAIAKAGSALVDAGMISAVQALLGKYGVDILTALDPSKYNDFAADLRALGAQI